MIWSMLAFCPYADIFKATRTRGTAIVSFVQGISNNPKLAGKAFLIGRMLI